MPSVFISSFFVFGTNQEAFLGLIIFTRNTSSLPIRQELQPSNQLDILDLDDFYSRIGTVLVQPKDEKYTHATLLPFQGAS